MARYILALDQGTTSSRAILFDRAGAVVGIEQQEFPQHYPQPAWVEHAPEDIWASQTGVVSRLLHTRGVAVTDIAALGMPALGAKSAELTEFFVRAVMATCPGFELVSPAPPTLRGSHVSLRHPQAYAICQALIARGVIGDFRDPDIMRFGFTPAYLKFAEVWRAVEHISAVLSASEWDDPQYRFRRAVT